MYNHRQPTHKSGAHKKIFRSSLFNLKSKFCHCVAYMIQDAFKGLRRYHKKKMSWLVDDGSLYLTLNPEKRRKKKNHAVKDQNILEYTDIERFITISNHAIAFQ